jgi:hypothetical protein
MTKRSFSVVVPGASSSYAVTVEADYFTVDENGFLSFSVTKDAGKVASFKDWIYVVTR